MPGIIAVHCGAGFHSQKFHDNYKNACKRACRAGVQALNDGGTALDAVKAALIVLEDDPFTNAGYGSNLTTEGEVESDASIMDGKTLTFGGCGAIKKVKNPISLAHTICIKQFESLPFGLVPPSLLVGSGGLKYARNNGIKVVNSKKLISDKARKQFTKYKQLLDVQKYELLDTVGAVCIDDSGHVASACSSGGLLLKVPGRVGQAALYGSGVWADSLNRSGASSIAVCTTGCGEHLVQTQLAKEIATDLKNGSFPPSDLHMTMSEKFMKSEHLRNVKQKMGGALVLHANNKMEVSLLWAHSTETMVLGFMKTTSDKPKCIISELPKDVPAGETVTVSGRCFYLQKNTK
nr:unnamed protein product [Callosobruchus analis]